MRAPDKLRAVNDLVQLTGSFPHKKVLVVGDLVADHYLYGQSDRVSREAPVLIVRYESSEVKLGGGANAAANARSLGAAVVLTGLLGEDEMGAALKERCRDFGIRLAAVTSASIETETKTRILAGGLNTTRQQMLRLDRGRLQPLSPSLRQRLCRTMEKAAKDVDGIIVSDYGAGTIDEQVRAVLLGLAKRGLPICVDSRYALAAFQGFPFLKPNEPELAALSGRTIRTEKDLLKAGREVMARMRCRGLLVTRGRSGMALFGPGGAVDFLEVHGSHEAVDVTGAGDTVLAAFGLAVAAGAIPFDAARLANVAGALVVQKQGTATVSHRELVSELSAA